MKSVADIEANIAVLKQRIARRRAAWAKAKGQAKPGKGALIAGWYAEWERRSMAMARDIGALDRLLRRLSRANERALSAARAAAKAARAGESHAYCLLTIEATFLKRQAMI